MICDTFMNESFRSLSCHIFNSEDPLLHLDQLSGTAEPLDVQLPRVSYSGRYGGHCGLLFEPGVQTCDHGAGWISGELVEGGMVGEREREMDGGWILIEGGRKRCRQTYLLA